MCPRGRPRGLHLCLSQFNIHALKLLHVGLGKCCQNYIIILAYPSKKAARLITNQNYTAYANPLFNFQETETINNK